LSGGDKLDSEIASNGVFILLTLVFSMTLSKLSTFSLNKFDYKNRLTLRERKHSRTERTPNSPVAVVAAVVPATGDNDTMLIQHFIVIATRILHSSTFTSLEY